MSLSSLWRGTLTGVVVVPLLAAAPVQAQDGFLFDEPRVTLSLRAGHHFASAGSDIYDEFTQLLTLEKRDFSGTALVGELGVRLAPRFDLVASAGRIESTASSESRTHLEYPEGSPEGIPIVQTTSLRRTPITATLKYYPLQRGRSIGSNAWIPVRFTPWLGAGGGALHYDLEQTGDFVDYASCDADDACSIFSGVFESDGWARTLHVAGGADYWLTTRLGVSADVRYQWGSAPLGSSFQGFDDIDLGGLQGTVGLSVRF